VAKVCPQCRTTHPDALEFCPRDGSALQPAESGRRHAATIMGSSGLTAPAPDPAAASAPTAPAPAASSGPSLADLAAKGALPADLATARIAEIADTLAADRNAVHGALTPRHIRYPFADFMGRPTILGPDLAGLDPALVANYRAPELSATAATPASAPTVASDVYSLGCILFELMAGRPPFKGKTAEELARRHASAAAPAIRQVRMDCELPPALEIEIQRALKKRPGDRQPSLQQFSQALRAAVRDDDRSTMALGSGEAAFLQQLLQQGSEAAQAPTPGPLAARAVRVPSAAHPLPPSAAPPPGRAPAPHMPPAAPRASSGVSQTSAGSAHSSAPTAPASPVPAPSSSKAGLAIAAVVVLIAVAGVAYWQVTRASAPVPAVPAAPAHVPDAPVVQAPAPPAPQPAPVVDRPDIVEEPVDAQIAAEEPDILAPSDVTVAKSRPRKGGPPASHGTQTPPDEKKPAGHDGPITF
jgi:hypothetical protein